MTILKPLDKFAALGAAIDQVSLQWLNDNVPALAQAVEDTVAAGASPAEVRRFVMRQTQRQELALRCEQAARALSM